MLIPPKVFVVSHLCEPNSSRYALGSVRLERDKDGPLAVATDGRRLLVVRWREMDYAEYPAKDIGDISPLSDFSTLILKKQWEELKKLPPKRTHKPILANIALCEKDTNGQITVGATDMKTTRRMTICATEGKFPDWRNCTPPREPHEEIKYTVNGALLADTLRTMAGLVTENNHNIVLHVPLDPECALIMKTDDGSGVTGIGMFMPMSSNETDRRTNDARSQARDELLAAVNGPDSCDKGARDIATAAIAMLSGPQLEALHKQCLGAEPE